MIDFRINDSRRHWNSPSIAGDGWGWSNWSVICQVTHRAHYLTASYSQARLESAYNDCRSVAAGPITSPAEAISIFAAHARAFQQPALIALTGYSVRRLVMADEFGPSIATVCATANSKTREQIIATFERYKHPGEIRRYLDLRYEPTFIDPNPIRAVTLDGRPWKSGS